MDAGTIASLTSALIAVAGGLAGVSRVIWRASADVRGLVTSVTDNTAATERLSRALETHQEETAGALGELDERVTALEQHGGSGAKSWASRS